MAAPPPDEASAALAALGVVESLVAEMIRAGRTPVLVVGQVPVPLPQPGGDRLRVALFAEAGAAGAPGWEGWLPAADPDELVERHAGLRAGAWDAGLAARWSVAWALDPAPASPTAASPTADDAPRFVAWTPAGSRLRVDADTVDVLHEGRWTVLPARRVTSVGLSAVQVGGPDGPTHGVLVLGTEDRRTIPFPAGRLESAAALGPALAEALGVDWRP